MDAEQSSQCLLNIAKGVRRFLERSENEQLLKDFTYITRMKLSGQWANHIYDHRLEQSMDARNWLNQAPPFYQHKSKVNPCFELATSLAMSMILNIPFSVDVQDFDEFTVNAYDLATSLHFD